MTQLRSKRKAPGATMPEENLNPISCELCRQRKCKGKRRNVPTPRVRLAETESALYGALMTIRSMGQSTAVQIPTKTGTALKHKAARMEEWSQLPLRDWPDMERWLSAMSDRFTIEQPSDVVPDTSGGGYAIPMTPTHGKSQTLGDQPHSGLVSYAWPPRDNRVSSGGSYDASQPHPGVMPSPVYLEHQVAVEPESVPSPDSSRDGLIGDEDAGLSVDVNVSARARGRPSKAEELSHNHPSLYF
ncbi:hypothetical protein N7447_007354 [Penicillium robsamsonii]|uniref:uncharacterized protein n=1 Tax=Penicillium robsamsonii TaxID=1792511 RepID=UPI00254898BA|nr:uncharacterized protein N7447_007354 [Penicillium robsamsonii]KAJ5825014.1 hypothetical protein N7447_007354 [Penicillium robsamsonii]